MIRALIDSFAFSFLFPVVLLAMIFLGYWIAQQFYKKRNRNWTGSGIENGVLGLYSLLLSFTLLLGGNAQKDRNVLVHQASDAAAQINRAAIFLSEDARVIIKKHLLDYLNLQVEIRDKESLYRSEALKKITELNQQLWTRLNEMKDSSGKQDEIKTLLPLYNQFNSSFYRLVYSYDERIPIIIMILLIISSWMIAILIGFMNGLKEHRHYLVPFIFIILVSLTVQAIRDLDNPYRGSVKPKYDNIIEIRNSLSQE